jgi:uncharacterized protein YlzI (FlbEa/FlbD family)
MSIRPAEGDALFIELTRLDGSTIVESLNNIRRINAVKDGSMIHLFRDNCYPVRQTLHEISTKLAVYGRLIQE